MDTAFSVYLYWAGIVAAGLAAMTYLAAWLRTHLAGTGATLLPAAAPVSLSFTAPVPGRLRAPYGLAALAVWLTVASLGAAMVTRVAETGHAPFSNLFEYSTAFAFGLAFVWAIAEPRTRAKATGFPVMVAAFGLAAGALVWPAEPEGTLVPALQANILLPLHVAMLLLAYALFGLAAGAAALYLVQAPKRRFQSLPPAPALDGLGARAVIYGFLLLTAGIALGAYWANNAWGRYWGWDPKETASLITWLIFAAHLHTRGLRGWQGRRSALLGILGFGAVLFTYFAVNLWVAGLHSYA